MALRGVTIAVLVGTLGGASGEAVELTAKIFNKKVAAKRTTLPARLCRTAAPPHKV